MHSCRAHRFRVPLAKSLLAQHADHMRLIVSTNFTACGERLHATLPDASGPTWMQQGSCTPYFSATLDLLVPLASAPGREPVCTKAA